jgi:hypothetical protein
MFQGRPKGTRSKHSPGESPPLLFFEVPAAEISRNVTNLVFCHNICLALLLAFQRCNGHLHQQDEIENIERNTVRVPLVVAKIKRYHNPPSAR